MALILGRASPVRLLRQGTGRPGRGVTILGRKASVGGGGGTAPANTVAPVVSGTATVGQMLSTTDGTWTGSPVITFTYQWQRAGVDIGGATNSTYVLVHADAGEVIRCVVTGTNGVGSSSANSNATAAVTEVPANTVAPVVSGTATAGQTLSTTNGTWTGSPSPTFTYQWQHGTTDIAGATASSYQIQSVYIGETIRCVVTGTNAVGNSSANSNATAAVAAPAAFVFDTFTGANGTLLSAHTGETGATWTRHPSYAGSTMSIQTNRIKEDVGSNGCYYASGTPVGADYTVSASLYCVDATSSNTFGVVGRLATAANTFYHGRYGGAANGWQLYKWVAGVATQLGSNSAATLTNTTSYDVTLKMVGTTISLIVDGVVKVSVTDNAIAAAGLAGVRGLGASYPLSSISAVDWYA